MEQLVEQAYSLAKETRKNAYAKFSNFLVGAVIKLEDDEELYTGCNVENSTFGLTICAERTGIVKAVSKNGGDIKIEFVVVVADTEEPTAPCGMCLQTINEFSTDKTMLHLGNLKSVLKSIPLKSAFPMGFKL